jgi:hypothetical protein
MVMANMYKHGREGGRGRMAPAQEGGREGEDGTSSGQGIAMGMIGVQLYHVNGPARLAYISECVTCPSWF